MFVIASYNHEQKTEKVTGTQPSSTRHRISIGVGQTVCFHGDNSTSDLQTLTLTQLEQYHPISQRYRFALPEVETNCICECSAASAICQASDYAFGQCDPTGNPSTVCHRTFFANQPTTGCIRHIDDHEERYKDGFSVPVREGESTNKSIKLRIRPYTAHTYHMVCLQPEDGMEELCRPVEAVVEARSIPEMSKSWMEDHSNCPECNQKTLYDFMAYFDPVDWLSNVSSLKDEAVRIVRGIMVIVVVFLVYSILKCVYPLLKCCICPAAQYVRIVKR
uniref:Ovule protein n=1 Tax=Panagrellus redivivus TaxID=6233 RepID=A0A7E4W8L9_PANRE